MRERADAPVTVIGAGILGLWQALVLARSGRRVTLFDRATDPARTSASSHAGAMLAPWCEAESAPAIVRDLGIKGLEMWRATYPHLVSAGSLVVAQPRDQPDLVRFARMTENHVTLSARELEDCEPGLAGRFPSALYFADEAHVETPDALAFLFNAIREAGATIRLGEEPHFGDTGGWTIDCRGLAARDALPDLRGVRGERVLIRTPDVVLSRPIRLLHPRHPLYIVPWPDGRFLVGATMIESEDPSPVTVRSALDLLGAAYALHPAFAEAEILELAAGVRPAFPDNVPRARRLEGSHTILVNGAYRHGYLLAPVLAQAVADHLAHEAAHPLLST